MVMAETPLPAAHAPGGAVEAKGEQLRNFSFHIDATSRTAVRLKAARWLTKLDRFNASELTVHIKLEG